jgi:hypothetical protein
MIKENKTNKKLKIEKPKHIRIVQTNECGFQIEYGKRIFFWICWKAVINVNNFNEAKGLINQQIFNNNFVPIELIHYSNIK